MMSAKPNTTVTVGTAKFGNTLPLAVIAGPCALESRAHALEMAAALKEITGKLGLGFVYKTSFDKANRTSAASARGLGLDKALTIFADLRDQLGVAVLTDVHEPDQCAAVAEVADILQIPAFLCRQTDLVCRCGKDRSCNQCQERPIPRSLGYGQCRRQNYRRRQSQRARYRTRRLVWLQHAGFRHEGVADPGENWDAGDLRCHPFGAEARRAGDFIWRRACLCFGPGACGNSSWHRRCVCRDASRSRSCAVRRAEHDCAQAIAAAS